MLGITCGKCGRRFTPGAADIQGYLAESAGKKFVQVLCPHCGYGNKVAVQRLQQAAKA
jgi:DNA-directed RNA polymerase subunit RPC12/RpoP